MRQIIIYIYIIMRTSRDATTTTATSESFLGGLWEDFTALFTFDSGDCFGLC